MRMDIEWMDRECIGLFLTYFMNKIKMEKRINLIFALDKIKQTPLMKVSAIKSYRRLIQKIVYQNWNVIIFVSAMAHWCVLLFALHLQKEITANF